jgi:ADP-heptose:LPS heptosyltransferase
MTDRRRILLVRLDGIGDALACVPSLEGLRRAFPDAAFAAVCSRVNADVFSRSRVPVVHVYDSSQPATTLAGEIRSEAYTDVLIATEEPIGYRIARTSGARRRAGFWHRFEKTFKSLWQYAQLTAPVYRPAAWVEEPEHEVSAMYRLAEKLGARDPIPADAAQLRSWLNIATPASPVAGSDAFAMQLAPKLFASGWSPKAAAAIARSALDASPFRRCVFYASANDEGLALAVMEHLPRNAVESGKFVVAPPTGIAQWLGAIASAGAIVTPDTGAAHAAGMLGVPVVDLFEAERFSQLVRQWRPWAARSVCLPKPQHSDEAETALGSSIGAALTELASASGRGV